MSSSWKDKFSQVSAKTLALGGKQYVRSCNERKIRYSDPFKYTPLSGPKCFRLLRILPGANTDAVEVEMYEANLDDKPVFEALSYTWDLTPRLDIRNFGESKDKGERRPILCNGNTVHVTMNLYLALLEFRGMKLESPLWADQICINQEDNGEKIPQLAIMAQIYSSASTVVIWLDTLTKLRSSALDFMEALPNEKPDRPTRATSDTPTQQSVLGKISRSFNATKEISRNVEQHCHWLAVVASLGCAWFDRIWTLQEFMLANRFRILMGNREIPPSAFVKAAAQIFEFYATDSLSVHAGINNYISSSFGVLAQNRSTLFEGRIQFQNGRRYSAAEYLVIARRREATVPVDLVFAGAELLEQGAPESVAYFSTTRDVFYAFAAERLWPQTGMESLSLVGGTSPKIEGLPSWCPDLSSELVPHPLRSCGCQTLQRPPMAPEGGGYVIQGQALHVKAVRWSSISRVGESLWSWVNWEQYPYNTEEDRRRATQVSRKRMKTSTASPQELFGLMLALLDGMEGVYMPTGERPIDALWNTLTGGTASASGEDTAVWRDRFHNFFALIYLTNRMGLENEKNSTSAPRPWKMSLIQDLPHLQERVTSFLDVHDRPLGQGQEPPLKKVIADLTDRIYSGSVLQALFRGDPSHEPAGKFSELFSKVYEGRRIFSTPNGYLGISTEDVRHGDVISLVAGASMPYVLRPVDGAAATFTLVGEAYVHGLTGDGDLNETGLVYSDIKIV